MWELKYTLSMEAESSFGINVCFEKAKVLSVQFSSVIQSCPTFWDPCSTPGFPVHHQLPELTQTHVHSVRHECPTTSSTVVPFSSYLQSLPTSESFPMSQLSTPALFKGQLYFLSSTTFFFFLIFFLICLIFCEPITIYPHNSPRGL